MARLGGSNLKCEKCSLILVPSSTRARDGVGDGRVSFENRKVRKERERARARTGVVEDRDVATALASVGRLTKKRCLSATSGVLFGVVGIVGEIKRGGATRNKRSVFTQEGLASLLRSHSLNTGPISLVHLASPTT